MKKLDKEDLKDKKMGRYSAKEERVEKKSKSRSGIVSGPKRLGPKNTGFGQKIVHNLRSVKVKHGKAA